MLKVNEEKLLNDHKELVEKKGVCVAKIEAETKAFASTLGYDDIKTSELVAFVIGKDNGLSDEENAKLNILSAYVEEIDDKDIPQDDEELPVNPEVAVFQNNNVVFNA